MLCPLGWRAAGVAGGWILAFLGLGSTLNAMLATGRRAALVALSAFVLSGCASSPPASCGPAATARDCFAISNRAFTERAVTSARALPELKDVPIVDARVLGGEDVTARTKTWVATLLSYRPNSVQLRIVAAARFVPAGAGQARLAEVAALREPLAALPEDTFGGDAVVLWANSGCAGQPRLACLFPDYEWAIHLVGGQYRLFTSPVEIVDTLPSPAPSPL
jgi:hypothetical protein